MERVEKLAELVSERTGGLSLNHENLDGISIGAFEMAQFCAGYHADKTPSITVLVLHLWGYALAPERNLDRPVTLPLVPDVAKQAAMEAEQVSSRDEKGA